jgi:hypothetical protein
MRVRSPLLLVLLLVAGAFAACVGPATERRRTPWSSAARVLALDLSAQAQRPQRLARLAAAPAREVARVPDLLAGVPSPVEELRRVQAAERRGVDIARAEAKRRVEVPASLRPDPRELGQDLADGLADTFHVLAERPVMPERDDRHHRTDPDDQRPEATLWQRVRRRLWL